MDDSFFGFVSIIVLGCGLYALYAYIKMKKDGHINETLLLGKNQMEYQCKDKDAFMKKASPAVLLFGVVSTLYGVVDLIHYYVTKIKILDTIAMIAFFVVLIWFMVYTAQLRKKFF